jgi:hypothetical protein
MERGIMRNQIGNSDGPHHDERHTPNQMPSGAIPADLRPLVTELFHTADLPPLPQRDRRLPASLWVEAPEALRTIGADLGYDVVAYKRRIGRWLLWRAGPAVDADARYAAIDVDDFDRMFTFQLDANGAGQGVGPDGVLYDRFRSWKEALRDT